MKKIYMILSSVLFAGAVLAQSQRLVLVEEFTQASCGPCASQNPAFNALLAANSSKLTSLKYQTSWPGVDPMNAQNPTDAANRVSYYNITGVPHGRLDGPAIVNDCNAYTGAPSCLSASEIDARYNTPSPFSLQLTHTMSVAHDSAYVTAVITAAQNFTANGTLRFRLALIEEEIHFTTPPGSNGEKDFYNVMRKMYPNGTGTALASTWTNGQTQTLNFAIKIPTYIYDINEVAFVAFIQSDGNKVVEQAGFSPPQPIQNDAGTTLVTGIPGLNCTGNFTPSVTIKNYGVANLTSCNVNYQIDANTPAVQPWTGNLAPGATTTVTLPQLNAGDGNHTLTVWTSDPNGQPDGLPGNNTTTTSFMITMQSIASPIIEGFQNASFPPTRWSVYNPDGSFTWARKTGAGGFGQSLYSAWLNFFDSPNGQIDELYLPSVDLSASATAASMSFNVAHSQYSTASVDRLQVRVSTDCGANWTTVYDKSGAQLKTNSGPQTSPFTPSGSMWRNEAIDLSQFAGQNNVYIKFVGISNSGNNVYVDDINISNTVGIKENTSFASLDVYPNPFLTTTTISLNLNKAERVTVRVFDVVGNTVYSMDAGLVKQGGSTLEFDGSQLPAGIYFLTLYAGDQNITKKLTINR